MEMHLAQGLVVHPGLGFGNASIDRQGIAADSFGKGQALDERCNFGKAPLMRMAVLMVTVAFVAVLMAVLMAMLMVVMVFVAVFMMLLMAVFALLLPVDGDVHPEAADSGGFSLLCMHLNPGDSQSVKFFDKGSRLGQAVQKSGGEHVSCRAHAAIKI